MNKKQRFEIVWNLLKKEYPDPKPALNYNNNLELLVATILSAQTTDSQVNETTKYLFNKYKSLEDYSNADLKELEKDVFSTGFYHNKAKNIKKTADIIIKEFNGTIPNNMDDLLILPGIGRKTANIILSRGFDKNYGIAVDTHVSRLARRLLLTSSNSPVKIENELMGLCDESEWEKLSMTFILHGRQICHAKKPNCYSCVINQYCPSKLA